MLSMRAEFQSTLPCGERPLMHTPPSICLEDFNPRSRVGSDPCGNSGHVVGKEFQSTLPCGERPLFITTLLSVFSISIHAPVWGATISGRGWHAAIQISIHAPVWGATNAGADFFQGALISIHAPVWGATANAHKPLASFQCRFDIFAQKKAKHPMFYLYSTTISCVFKTFFSAKVRCFLWALPLRTLSLSII